MPEEVTKSINSMILLSGGIDSAACVHYYLSQKYNVKGIFVDYGQITKKMELSSAKKVASYFGIDLEHLIFNTKKNFSQDEIKGRNAILVLSILPYYPNYNGIISLGIHSGVPYYDCSESFVKDINKILVGYTDGKITLDAPFLKWDKKMIYEYCNKHDVPIELTFSCENGPEEPCGMCRSCLDRSALDAV